MSNHEKLSPSSSPPTYSQKSEDHRKHGLRDGLDGLRDLMDRLLGEQGCPWDREQSLESLRPFLLEEAYEVLDAMDSPEAHRLELGDLLFQIVFQSALRERQQAFDLEDVIEGVRSKMIRRHPHIFAPKTGAQALTSDEVRKNWQILKQQEKSSNSHLHQKPFASISQGLPALMRAAKMQEKAAEYGFDWPDKNGPQQKAQEEWTELEEAIESGSSQRIREELGDLLFVLVRLGQKLGVSAEDALASANHKFEQRFTYVLEQCALRAWAPQEVGLEVLDQLWNESKG